MVAQVAALLDAAALYLQDHALDSLPCPVLRAAMDLQLVRLAEHIERDFLQVVCGQRQVGICPPCMVGLA